MNAILSKIFCAQRVLKNEPPQGEIPDDESLLRRTIRVAWPSTLESFLVALVGMVDTIMVSRLGSYAIAAVGLTTQPKFICLAVFMSLNVAVSALVARRKGEGDREGANRVLAQSMVLTLMFAVVITALAIVLAEPILRLTGSNADTHESASAYFRIISAGMIFNVMSMVINAAQRGAGNTKIAMRTNLVSNGVNIVFNYLLIEGHFGFPRLGVAGAAVATVIGTMVALCMSVLSVMHPDGFLYLQFERKRFRLQRSTLATIANIGSSSLAEQLFLRFGFLTYAMIVARLGTTAFAAHQVGMNVITISFAFGDGLSVASVALVGQSLGERRGDLARIYLSFCQRVGLFCSLTLAVVYSVVGRDIFRLFSSEEQILVYGEMIMRMVALIVIMQVAQVISSGCLRGAGDTKYVAIVSLVSVACIRPLSGYLFTYPFGLGLFGAWIGLVLDQFMRLLLTSLRVRSGKWLNIRI